MKKLFSLVVLFLIPLQCFAFGLREYRYMILNSWTYDVERMFVKAENVLRPRIILGTVQYADPFKRFERLLTNGYQEVAVNDTFCVRPILNQDPYFTPCVR